VNWHPGFNEYFEILGRTMAILPIENIRERIGEIRKSHSISWLDAFYGIEEKDSKGQNEELRIDFHNPDGAIVRMQMRRENGTEIMAIIESLKEMKMGSGFSGFVKSNLGKLKKDNIQHSSLIGNWIAQAGFALTENQSFTRNGIFNSCGHLLHIR
jgi:hypothetical protein